MAPPPRRQGDDGVVTHYVGSHFDITERKAADETKHLAFYKPLTRLPNRQFLMDRLQQALVSSARGDEFVVTLEDMSNILWKRRHRPEAIGDKILATLNQPCQLDTHEHRSTPSIGATLFNDHEQTQDELLKQADIAMYQAKASGRNALRFSTRRCRPPLTLVQALEGELRKALEGQ